jgi:hypothetical protein
MFEKILIANRGDKARAAGLAAKPHCVVRAAHAGDLAPIEVQHV